MVRADSYPRDAEGLDDKMAALCRWASPQDGGRYGISQLAVETARREILDANGGNPPKNSLDCFAGGGAIPLEVARLGGQAYAVELNPVAYLIELCVLVYPQTYGASLAEDVAKWGQWILERARDEIGDLYPAIGASHEQPTLDGTRTYVNATATPVAYLWTRTVPRPTPALQPHDLDLVRQTWLVKKPGNSGRRASLWRSSPWVSQASGGALRGRQRGHGGRPRLRSRTWGASAATHRAVSVGLPYQPTTSNE